jgi:short-subunit dehydrogenase
MPKLLSVANAAKAKTPSLLVTSGMLAKDPFPAMFSLAACKAGQYSLVNSLHKEFEPKGVHCGLVVVGGSVKEDAEVTNPRGIAEETWRLFCQEQGSGQLELLLIDPEFEEHVRSREKRER